MELTDVYTEIESLNWLVENFARSVPGLRQAVVVSADGLSSPPPGAWTAPTPTSSPRSPPV